MKRATPPRFVVRTLVATLAMIAFVLSAVFLVVALNVRQRVRGEVADKLEAGQRMLSTMEQRRALELQTQVATLAESPALKTAMDAYYADLTVSGAAGRRQMAVGVERTLETLTARARADLLAVTDAAGRTIAVAGRRRDDWPAETLPSIPNGSPASVSFVTLPAGVFRVATASVRFEDAILGSLQLATALDDRYARELSILSGVGTLILFGDQITATTLPPTPVKALTPTVLRALRSSEVVTLGDSEYAVRLLFQDGNTRVYAFDSIDASAAASLRDALRAVFVIALGSFALAALASLWLAQMLARPIDTLSRSLSEMTRSRDFDNPVAPTGFSLEVDTLTTAFNQMMHSLGAAEAETRSAYVGAIRALALALDARDPYTAGHSERVSALSVAIGRQLGINEQELETLRLGALLHDIGKIGISDHVLRKPGALTPDEFEIIKQHPGVGARILRSVPFLSAHAAIVELHHERPDGSGYPHGLRGEEIPLLARIVHVADAFDAITSARAYRPARAGSDAVRELWRCAGAQFDVEVVQALVSAHPALEPATTHVTSSAPRTPRLSVVSVASRS